MKRGRCLILLAACAACGKVGKTNPDAAKPPIDGPGTGAATLTLAKPSRWVPQNGQASVDFSITRGTSAALTVGVTGQPTGVNVQDVQVAAGATTGTLVFVANSSSVLGSKTTVMVQLLDGTQLLDAKPFTVMVSGAPGTLDTTFGVNGRITIPLPDPVLGAPTTGNGLARSVAIYPDSGANADKIVIAAQLDTTGTASTTRKLALIRLGTDGNPDSGFGTSGYALIDGSPSNNFLPEDVAIDSQGRVAVVAVQQPTGSCNNFVARVTATGTVDSGFTTYNAAPPGGFCGDPASLAILPSDKLAVLSIWNNSDMSQRPLLLQLNSDGTVDSTAFSGTNPIRLPNPDTTKPTMNTYRLRIDGQGRWLLAGNKCEGGWATAYSACESVIGRVTSAGAWDMSFGTAGAGGLGYSALTFGTTASPPQAQGFNSMVIDGSGNIVPVGWSENYTTGTLARFLSINGALDQTFASSGRASPVLVQGGTVQELNDVAVDGDGNVLAAGYSTNGGPLIAVTRYTPAGVLDTTYGTGGVQTVQAGGLQPRAAIQPDGRFVVVGTYPRSGGGNDVAAWRFWP